MAGDAPPVGGVHLDQRGHGTFEKAVGSLQREGTIRAGLAGFDSVMRRQLAQQPGAAGERATEPGADPHVMLPARGEPKLRIPGRDTPHLAHGHSQMRGDLRQRHVGQIPDRFLNGVKRRQQPGPLPRAVGDRARDVHVGR